MSDLSGQGLAEYAISKKGAPYFYGAKITEGVLTENKMGAMHKAYPSIVNDAYINKARNKKQIGKINTDCSGLPAAYRKVNIGSAQLYATAYTRLPIKDVKEFAIGTILWKQGHVGVYIGLVNNVPTCIEAKGINYGTIQSKVSDTPWQYGLTFRDIEYVYKKNLVSGSTWKGNNPYQEPTSTINRDMKGKGVSWVQWELREAGYDIMVDGVFGDITDKAVRRYQASCKLMVDGKVGPKTIAAFKQQ